MKNSLNIEAEGGELIIRNKNNDYAIIPKDMRREVINLMKKGCYDCIDKIVSTLPTANNYAEDGTIIPFKTTAKVSNKPSLNHSSMVPVKTNANLPYDKLPTGEEFFLSAKMPVDNTKVETKITFPDFNRETEKIKEQDNYRQNALKVVKEDKPVNLNTVTNLDSLDASKVKEIQKELMQKGYLGSTLVSVDKSNKANVKQVQELLISRGYDLGKYGVDGIYGKFTDAALKKFNQDNAKDIDGIVGPKTKEAFRKYQLDRKNFENKLKLDLSGKSEKEIQQKLISQNFFRNKKEDFNFNTDNISLKEQKGGFKVTNDDVCTSTQCTAFVGQEIEKVIKEKGRESIDAYGDAWTIRDRLIKSGAESIYNVFPATKPKVSNVKSYIENLTNKPINLKKEDFKPGDVINLYYGGSSFTNQAYKEGSSVFSTHAGIVKEDGKGNLVVEHNVGGKIKREPLDVLLQNKGKTESNKPLRITAVTRPNYGTINYANVYDSTELSINFDNVVNVKTSLGSKQAAEFTQVLINNKDKIVSDIPINENEFNYLLKVSRILGWKESNFKAQPKTNFMEAGSKLREALGIRESSQGFTLLKDEENISPEIRSRLGINNESLRDPKISAIATMYALSTKYLKIKSSLEGKNFTEDELAQLALISWNEPVDKVIKTAEKYKSLDKVIKAYEDSYGYNSKGETLFPSKLPLTGYDKYLK